MKPLLKHDNVVKILRDKKGREFRVWFGISLYSNILDPKGNYVCGIYKVGGYTSNQFGGNIWDSMEYISNEEASKITELKADIQETIKRYPYLQELNKGEKKMNKKGICPYCGSDIIEYGLLCWNNEDDVTQECNCGSCGKSFDEIYNTKYDHTDTYEDDND